MYNKSLLRQQAVCNAILKYSEIKDKGDPFSCRGRPSVENQATGFVKCPARIRLALSTRADASAAKPRAGIANVDE